MNVMLIMFEFSWWNY